MRAHIYLILFLSFIISGSLTFPVRASQMRIHSGDRITGILDEWDDQTDDLCFLDSYIIDCQRGNLLMITQRSASIDSYLIVEGPDGMQWENDDYSYEVEFDSRLLIPIDVGGEYTIHCTTFEPDTGQYELTVEEITPLRFFGIFVGVSDYGIEYVEAPNCDKDALNLSRAFLRSGLMDSGDAIVLTNDSATREDIEDAFQEISLEIGPDDIFIFFFSGHGDRVKVSSADRVSELDEFDEVIALGDSDITDNDLAIMLQEIDAGLKVAVIDSCYSGGFTRDLVAGPDIICFAACEEDVLGDFAGEYKAGGYLSIYLCDAVLGDGDLDRDGLILVGELTHYLVKRYNQEGLFPDYTLYGFQEFVFDRGLVSQDTIFCWWDPDFEPEYPDSATGPED